MIIPQVLTHKRITRLVEDLRQAILRRSRAWRRPGSAASSRCRLGRGITPSEIAREVLGREAYPYHAALFDKSPDANWLVVWH
jgi:hypothetical protein